MRTSKRFLAAIALATTAVASPATASHAQATQGCADHVLTVADFNSGRKPNNLGRDFGAWIKDPSDPLQGSIEAFDRENRFGDRGYALRLIYSVASDRPAFGGLWMQLGNLNAKRFEHLALRVRGDSALGHTSVFIVELKDEENRASRFRVEGVTNNWQDISIRLSDFQGSVDMTRLSEFVIVIEDRSATALQGILYLDDVRFIRGSC